MPHVWIQQTREDTTQSASSWVERRLDDLLELDLGGKRGAGLGGLPGAARIVSSAGQWLLLVSPTAGVAVNGMPVSTGIHTLVDRDEIQGNDLARVYFSTECPPAIVAYPRDDASARCPRCQQTIEHDSSSVRCHCGAYYHQSEALPCYLYGPCVLCGAPTDLDGSYRWTPESL